ncbi:PIH1 domain-containing protein 1-like isoform X2 [Euwallacea similis]|uniref:PIH1 domain-containing protein 1-like isoform X2 n=1 Tax=Euwallacea similis TaxID=1736056 RepID=UPI00344E320C
MSSSNPIFLDVDSSIVESNLRITGDSDELDKLIDSVIPQFPSKLVKPHPGICIKTREVGTQVKVFVNVCTTDAIPPPKDITETELNDIIEAEDSGTFKIPMSIAELRTEKDKNAVDAKVVDIAVHPTFLQKVQTYQNFKHFLIALIFQALLDKYSLLCEDKKIILTNKKAFGTLQPHRIQQRDIDEKMGKLQENQSAMGELTGESKEPSKKVLIETISSMENKARVPEYRLFKKKNGLNCLFAEFKFPDVISAKDINVDVGEDRIIVESQSKGYFLDIFVPCCIRAEKSTSVFDKALKVLSVKMPLVGG